MPVGTSVNLFVKQNGSILPTEFDDLAEPPQNVCAVMQPGTTSKGGLNEYGVITYTQVGSSTKAIVRQPLLATLIDAKHPFTEQSCLLITNQRTITIPFDDALQHFTDPGQIVQLKNGEVPLTLFPPNKVVLSNGNADFTQHPEIDLENAIQTIRQSIELNQILPYNVFVIYDTPIGQRLALISKITTFEIIFRLAHIIGLDIDATRFSICQGEYNGGDFRFTEGVIPTLVRDGLTLQDGGNTLTDEEVDTTLPPKFLLASNLSRLALRKRSDILVFPK